VDPAFHSLLPQHTSNRQSRSRNLLTRIYCVSYLPTVLKRQIVFRRDTKSVAAEYCFKTYTLRKVFGYDKRLTDVVFVTKVWISYLNSTQVLFLCLWPRLKASYATARHVTCELFYSSCSTGAVVSEPPGRSWPTSSGKHWHTTPRQPVKDSRVVGLRLLTSVVGTEDFDFLYQPASVRNIFHSKKNSVRHFMNLHTSSSKVPLILTNLLTYLLTYLLTPWCRVLLEKLTGLQLVK